jgi:hypothetical protein
VTRKCFHSFGILVFILLCIAQPQSRTIHIAIQQTTRCCQLKDEANALIEKRHYSEALPLIKKSVELEHDLMVIRMHVASTDSGFLVSPIISWPAIEMHSQSTPRAHHGSFVQWQDAALSTRWREFDSPRSRSERPI